MGNATLSKFLYHYMPLQNRTMRIGEKHLNYPKYF